MKKLFFAILISLTFGISSNASATESQIVSESAQSVSFRTNQTLKGNDGYTIYIYTDHTFKVCNQNDICTLSGTWSLTGRERGNKQMTFYFKETDMEMIGNCVIASTGNISFLDLNEVRYWNKNR